MKARLLIDNWTLQDVGKLLDDGFEGGTVPEIEFTRGGKSFRYAKASSDLVRLDCLLKLLGAVVFSERVLVDAKFEYTWEKCDALGLLRRERVVIGGGRVGSATGSDRRAIMCVPQDTAAPL